MRNFVAVAAPLALLLAAGTAGAADVTYPDGRTEKGISPGKVVVGPARIAGSKGNDSIELHKGAEVRFVDTDKDEKGNTAENYFLKTGGVDADLGPFTRLATPSFWVFPEKAGVRVLFYAETFNATTAYARTKEKSGLARLVVHPSDKGSLEVHLGENQGVTLDSPRDAKGKQRDDALNFVTDPHNEWRADAAAGRTGTVRILYPVASTNLLVDLYVPKATMGSFRDKLNADGSVDPSKVEIENRISSWKSAGIRVATSRAGNVLSKNADGTDPVIMPGVRAEIDKGSGKVELAPLKEVPPSLKAAVSLTSEFASLATSPLTKP